MARLHAGGHRHEVSNDLSETEIQDSSDDVNSDSPLHSKNPTDSSTGSTRQSLLAREKM